jgi:hypothetical protein
VLTRSDNAYIVAHCRKKGNGPGEYGDIAVIQYSRKNGATCFYQALGSGLSGDVKAPSAGQIPRSIWLSPAGPGGTASIGCARCHDNGPFIRSPYLNQVKGPNALPGSDDFSFNSVQPYSLVGKDFASWKAYKVEIKNNECNSCHRMGVNNIRGDGTALDFGERATSATEVSEVNSAPSHKNPPSASSPIWMPPVPVQLSPSPAHAASAKAIHDCAMRWRESPLPDSDTCRITQFAGAYVPSPPSGEADAVTIIQLIQMPTR